MVRALTRKHSEITGQDAREIHARGSDNEGEILRRRRASPTKTPATSIIPSLLSWSSLQSFCALSKAHLSPVPFHCLRDLTHAAPS